MPDVEGDDLPRAPLQEHVREPPGRRADVERHGACDIDAERLERVRELQAPASDIRVMRHAQRDLGFVGDAGPRLGCRLAVDADLPGQNQRTRPLPRRHEAAADEKDVETVVGH